MRFLSDCPHLIHLVRRPIAAQRIAYQGAATLSWLCFYPRSQQSSAPLFLRRWRFLGLEVSCKRSLDIDLCENKLRFIKQLSALGYRARAV